MTWLKRASRNRKFAAATLLFALGMFLIGLSVLNHEPHPDELKPVTGTVNEVIAVKNLRGKVRRYLFTLAGHPEVFILDRLSGGKAQLSQGSAVTVHAAFDGESPRKTPNGNVKTYGLVHNGALVEGHEVDLAANTSALEKGLPIIGMLSFVLGFAIWRSGLQEKRAKLQD